MDVAEECLSSSHSLSFNSSPIFLSFFLSFFKRELPSTPLKGKEKEVGFFSCLCLPKGKKKDKGRLRMVQIKSAHFRMTQIKSGWLWMVQIKSGRLRLIRIKSGRLRMAKIKSGHPQRASFGCCALLMDEQTFAWD